MAKKRVKKRTQTVATNAPGASKPGGSGSSRVPQSMVLRVGGSAVGPSITQLVHDVRGVMSPNTASRLKERRTNKLRDYTAMAGPLGVTHLLLFSRSSETGNVNLRLALTPRGPTFYFRVEKYALAKDVKAHQKRAKMGVEKEMRREAPILVLSNIVTSDKKSDKEADGAATEGSVPRRLETLTTTVLQSLFPTLNPQTASISSMKRALLIDRVASPENGGMVLDWRHYAIETRTSKSLPRKLRRINPDSVPNLGALGDVSDYLLGPQDGIGSEGGFTSEEDSENEVEVLKAARARKDDRRAPCLVEKKALRLVELGPRMRLRLLKVEEGLVGGKVMWHEYITKGKGEVEKLEKLHRLRREEKERRRKEQEENIQRKRKGKGEDGKNEDEEDEEDWDWDDDESGDDAMDVDEDENE